MTLPRTTSPELLDRYLAWLDARGVRVGSIEGAEQRMDFVGPLGGSNTRGPKFTIDGCALDESRDEAAVIAADHATEDVVAALGRDDVWMNARDVWDIGCGTGVLAIMAAKRGAAVVATDISSAALAHMRENAKRAGVALDMRLGSNTDPLTSSDRADLVLANLPHKPNGGMPSLPVAQDGGEHGDQHHADLAEQMRARLEPQARVVTFLHSLPTPRLLAHYTNGYRLKLLSWKVRWFGQDEYAVFRPMLRARCAQNESYLVSEGAREGAVACVWMATRV